MISLEEDMRQSMERAMILCAFIDRLCDRAKTRAVATQASPGAGSRLRHSVSVNYREGADND